MIKDIDNLKNTVAGLIDEIFSERQKTQLEQTSKARNELRNRLRINKEQQSRMRAESLTLIAKPEVILEPWCNLGTPGVDYIIPVQTSGDPDIMTQDDGIPLSMQVPLPSGGIPVPRNQTNGYMYLYSSILAWIQAGGTFTFEPTVSAFNSGYPMGTVLWAASVNNFVVSLINNNTNNFVTTPSFIDGVHWQTITALTYPDITDVAGLVSIIGTNGLLVTGMSTFNSAVSFLNGFGVSGVCTFNEIASRGGIIIDAVSGTVAYLGSNNTSTGGLNGFTFDDTIGRPILNNPSAAISNVHEVACINDFSQVQVFSVTDTGGNAWMLLCQSFTGGFPSSNFFVIGNSNYNFPSGISSANIDLGAAGIASANATLALFAPTSETDYNTNLASLSIFTNATTKLITIGTTGSPGSGTNLIQFQVIYK